MLPTLAATAATQHGVFTRAQALAAGYREEQIRHRLRGAWTTLYVGVYVETAAYEGVGELWRPTVRAIAALLALPAGAAVSHQSAARLWGLPLLVASDLARATRRRVGAKSLVRCAAFGGPAIFSGGSVPQLAAQSALEGPRVRVQRPAARRTPGRVWHAGRVCEPSEWMTVPEVAERLDIPVTRVRQLLREGRLLAVRRDDVLRVPADFITGDQVLKGLAGTITLLRDARYDDEESLRWLYRADDSLPGTPVQALAENRGTEVKRRAQAAGF